MDSTASPQAIRPREVRKAAATVRRHLARGNALLDARDVAGAYAAYEAAQHAAFDAKMLIANGGDYDPDAE